MQVRLWEQYRDQGVQVWGIATREPRDRVQPYVDALGVDFPILLDETGEVDRLYDLAFAFPTGAYPQDFVVGTDGRIVYANNEPDTEAIERAVVSELAE